MKFTIGVSGCQLPLSINSFVEKTGYTSNTTMQGKVVLRRLLCNTVAITRLHLLLLCLTQFTHYTWVIVYCIACSIVINTGL